MSTRAAIRRVGTHTRWSDIVIHQHVARWVEVATDLSTDTSAQITQILAQIDETLQSLGAARTDLLEVIIHLARLEDAAILNALWDPWVPRGSAPIRACVQSGLGGSCRAEFIIHAAVAE